MSQSLSEIKRTTDVSTIKFVLLSLFTGGIFTLMWMYASHNKIVETTKVEFASRGMVLAIAVLFGLGGALAGVEPGYDTQGIIIFGSILVLCSTIAQIVYAFKVRSAILTYCAREFKFAPKFNGVLTFLFTVIYVNHVINGLQEQLERHQYIAGEK